jgi:hypothetical protein
MTVDRHQHTFVIRRQMHHSKTIIYCTQFTFHTSVKSIKVLPIFEVKKARYGSPMAIWATVVLKIRAIKSPQLALESGTYSPHVPAMLNLFRFISIEVLILSYRNAASIEAGTPRDAPMKKAGVYGDMSLK